jgi:hypothetical protein
MRLFIISDAVGNVLSTALSGTFKGEDGDAIEVGFVPGDGEQVLEAEVPDDYQRLSPAEIHEKVQEHVFRNRPWFPRR